MKIAFIFLVYHPFGHFRGLFEGILRSFYGDDYYFYINSVHPLMIPAELWKDRNIIYFDNFEGLLRELSFNGDIDAIIIFDLDPKFIDALMKVDFSTKRVILYNASVDILTSGDSLSTLLSKGFIFLLEHEVAYHIAKKYVFAEGNWGILPYPVIVERELEASHQSYDFLFPGSFEERKGASVLLMVIPDILKVGLSVRTSLFSFEMNELMLLWLVKYEGKVSLKKKPDESQSDFIKELISSRFVFFPYDPYQYSLSGSGILKECMVYGIPVIVTKNSFLSYYLEKNGGSWVPLESRIDKEAIMKTIIGSIEDYDYLKEKALKVRDKIETENSIYYFKNRLLNFIENGVSSANMYLPEALLCRAESYFLYFKASMVYRQGKDEEAEELLDRALAKDHSYWRALFLKSDLLSRKGMYLRAVELIEKAESNPMISPLNRAYALVKKAVLFEKIGRISLCIDALSSIREFYPYFSMRCLDELLEIKSAKETSILADLFSILTNLTSYILPRLYEIRLLLRASYIGLLIDKPINVLFSKLYENVRSLASEDEALLEADYHGIRGAFYNLIVLLVDRGRKEEAEVALDLFVHLFGRFVYKNPLYSYTMASLLEKLGDLDKAERLFYNALAQDFYNKSGIYFHLGEIALRKGDKEEAVKFYRYCLNYEREHSLALKRLKELEVEKNGVQGNGSGA